MNSKRGQTLDIYAAHRRVALDIGNVLCHVDVNEFMDFIVDENIVENKEHAKGFIDGIQYAQDLGLYNIRQGFYRFKPHLDKKTLQKIYDKWIDIVHPSDPMLGVVEDAITKHHFEVALLSNIGKDHADIIRQKCDIFKKCLQHFSCEVGARKPTRLYYQSFVMHYGWENALFFDDREENVKGCEGYFIGNRFDLDDFENDDAAASAMRKFLEDEAALVDVVNTNTFD